MDIDKTEQERVAQAKAKIREQLKSNGYQVWVFNTFKGNCWDKAESKGFILAFPIIKDGVIDMITLNPRYLYNLGWDTHYKKSYAEAGLFYDDVLGMSRAFNIVYNFSSWLFKELSEEDLKAINEKGDAGYIIHQR